MGEVDSAEFARGAYPPPLGHPPAIAGRRRRVWPPGARHAMGETAERKKIIIDTDPGIDDAMAIFVALESPEIEVVGLTTIYGNVYTTLATRNALHLLSRR